MVDDASYTLLAAKGCGSVIVEAALALSGLPHRVEETPYDEPGPARDRLRALNPLGQVPVLLLPDGEVMTESAAMVLHLADRAPEAGLAPPPDDPTRPAFLRWLVFLVGAIAEYALLIYAGISNVLHFDQVAVNDSVPFLSVFVTVLYTGLIFWGAPALLNPDVRLSLQSAPADSE